MNRSALWVGAGCLGCIGVPSLLAMGGAGGYFFALSRDPVAVEFSMPKGETDSTSSWAVSEARTGEAREREEALVKELAAEREREQEAEAAAYRAAVATPVVVETPVVVATPVPTPEKLARLAQPISTTAPKPVARPVTTPARLATPKAKPATVAKLSQPISAPVPKSTPRNFDEPVFKVTKPVKTASAGSGTTGSETEEDVAVAALFGDAPGSSVPAAAPAGAPAAASSAKVKTLKTRGGPVQATVGKKIAIQSADRKTILGTLEKVEGGWVAIRTSDGKVKMIAESEIVDASEL